MSAVTSHVPPAGPRAPNPSRPGPAGYLLNWRASLRAADRACCCPARPAVVVIMPAVPGRGHPVDLLLCGHHYQVSRSALADAGAAVLDSGGAPVSPWDLEVAQLPG